jgi:hypothetical protein
MPRPPTIRLVQAELLNIDNSFDGGELLVAVVQKRCPQLMLFSAKIRGVEPPISGFEHLSRALGIPLVRLYPNWEA